MTLTLAEKQMGPRRSTIVWDISLAMLLIFAATVCLTTFAFVFGVSVGWYHFVGAVVVTYFVMHRLRQVSMLRAMAIVGAAILIIGAFCLVAGSVYDTTWDGAAYHKQAVGLLSSGWNPLYQSAEYYESIAQTTPYLAANPIKWAETYPKATWYFAAVMYRVFGNIEAGKAYTLIFMFITGGFFYDYLSTKKVARSWRIGLTLLAALNPIALAQFQSYYLDGLVCSVIMCMLLLMIRSLDQADTHDRVGQGVAMIALLVIGCNLKFSVLLVCVLYCFVYAVVCALLCLKKRCAVRTFFLRSGLLVAGGVCAVVAVGASPYLTNIKRYGSAFGSFADLLNTPGMTDNSGLVGASGVQLILSSLFGKMSHGEFTSSAELLKMPFTIFPSEIVYYRYVDTRMGGMGVLFSGVVVLSAILLVLLGAYCILRKKGLPDWGLLLCVFGVTTVGYMLLLPLTFQLRYVSFAYVLPILLLAVLVQMADKREKHHLLLAGKLVGGLMCLTIVCNMLPWFWAAAQQINRSVDTTATLQRLQSMNLSKENLQISLYARDFSGIHYNLQKDFDLEYTYVEYEDIPAIGGFSHTFAEWVYYRIIE